MCFFLIALESPILKKKKVHLVLYLFWGCMDAKPRFTYRNKESHYMVSYKQCTVLVFAGKLMW